MGILIVFAQHAKRISFKQMHRNLHCWRIRAFFFQAFWSIRETTRHRQPIHEADGDAHLTSFIRSNSPPAFYNFKLFKATRNNQRFNLTNYVLSLFL